MSGNERVAQALLETVRALRVAREGICAARLELFDAAENGNVMAAFDDGQLHAMFAELCDLQTRVTGLRKSISRRHARHKREHDEAEAVTSR